MKKKWFIIFFIFIALGTGLYFYISNYFLPIQLKQILTGKAQEYLERKISFEEITYSPLKGVVIKELIIYQKENAQEPFFRASEITGNIVITSLLKSKKIVIPAITLKHPQVTVKRRGVNEWNFSDLLKKKTSQEHKSPLQVLVGSLAIEHGQIAYQNDLTLEPFAFALQNLQLKINLSLKAGIAFDLNAQLIEGLPQGRNSDSIIQAKGHFNPLLRELSTHLSVQKIALDKYLDEFYPSAAFSLKDGYIEQAQTDFHLNKNDFRIKGEIKAKAEVSAFGKEYKGNFHLKDFALVREAPSTVKLSGLCEAKDARVRFNENGFFEGSGSLKIKEMRVTGQEVFLKGDVATGPSAVQWEENRTLKGTITLSSLTITRDTDALDIDTQINIKNAQARFDDKINLKGDISESSLSTSLKNSVLTLKTSFKIDAADIKVQDNKKINGTLIANDFSIINFAGQTDGNGELRLDNGVLNFNGITYTGSPQLTFEFVSNPNKDQPLTYRGILRAKKGLLENIPRLGWLDGIEGTINFRTHHFQTDNLNLLFDGIPVQLSGSVTGFENPKLDVEAQLQNADLKKLYSYLSDQIKQSGIKPTGSADIKLAYKGPLDPFDSNGLNLEANLRNGNLSGLKVPKNLSSEITNISGIVKLKNNTVYWKNLHGTYLNEIYTINGQMENLASPLIETEVTSSKTNIYTRLSLGKDTYNISVIKGVYENISFGLTGLIQKLGPQEMYFDLDGNLALDAADLASILPGKKEQIESLKPVGTLKLALRYKGQGNTPENSHFKADLTCPELSLNGYRFKEISADLTHDPGQTGQLNAYGLFYTGDLSISSLFDLNKKAWPAKFSLQLKNSDLALLRKDSPLKGQDLAGKLNIQLDASGSLKDLNTLTGGGELTITEGHIWKLKILDGVWKMLFIPEFEGVVFTDANVPLTIKDRRFTTDNLLLKGRAADMTGHGWIDFDKNLNVSVSPSFKQPDAFRSSSLKKSLSSLLAGSEGYIVIAISGSLDKPRYTLNTLPTKVLKKATDTLIEGVGDLLKDLF